MPKPEKTKERFLLIMDILRQETDEDHHLSTREFLERLDQAGIQAERKTLYRDFDTLIDWGWDILHDAGGYYLASGDFELPELKLLADSIQCSRFITEKKSYALIQKLATLTSRHQAQELRRQLHLVGRAKASNENIYYIIDSIYSAMNRNREISFDYMEWRSDGKRYVKNEGRVVSPYALCWENENYYLVAHREPDGKRHYRVDRMDHIQVLDTPRKHPELYEDLNMAEYSKQVFGMYGGRSANVRLQFTDDLADSAVDKFGSGIMMVPQGDGTFTVTVPVLISPNFYSWVFSFAGRARILEPESVREEYLEMCRKAMEN